MTADSEPKHPIEVAGPEDLEALARVVARRPYHVCPARTWAPADVRDFWLRLLRERYHLVLEEPSMEVLIERDGGEIRSFILLHHASKEGSTGRLQSRVAPPSWMDSPRLVEEAARRAAARGSDLLVADLMVDDAHQRHICEQAGMVAEYQRIVLRLETFGEPASSEGEASRTRESLRKLAFARSARGISLRRAEPSDRFFLMQISTECAALMFHERRDRDMERVRQRFFDAYGLVDLGPSCPLHVWIAETTTREPAAVLLVDPEAEQALDETWEGYIYDISVLPQHWGRAYAVALVSRGIEELKKQGAAWMTGDISTDNERVMALADRFGFVPETCHYVRILTEGARDEGCAARETRENGEENTDGQ